MPDSASSLLRVAAARADFLESGVEAAAGVDDYLVASWQRCHDAGVDVSAPRSEFSDDLDMGSLLVRCASPVLDQLVSDTGDVPLVIALTDSRARVVRRIDVSGAVGRLLDRVDFAPGYTYSESTMGTNGVGTVLEAGASVSVVGPAHFTEQLQPFACTGSPIVDPITGRIEGVLDLSTLTASWSPVMHALVKAAAKDIGHNLLMDRSQAQQAIFSAYMRAVARSSKHAVLAFGDAVYMANPLTQKLFSADEQQMIREHAGFLMSHRNRASDTVALPGGQLVHVRGTRIDIGTAVAGMVVVAEAVTPGQRPPQAHNDDFTVVRIPSAGVTSAATGEIAESLGRTHEPTAATGHTPAWRSSCEELRTALASQQPVVVLGETGTGKFTLVGELFHEVYAGARSVVVDATTFDRTGALPLDESLIEQSSTPTLFIVRNIDQCSTQAAERLDTLLTQIENTAGPIWHVATLSDSALESDLPFRQLLSHFEGSIALPALRFRTDDLKEIVANLLNVHAPGRRIRFSPQAWRIIRNYSWPRNITQLRDALDHALRRRPAGEIQASDLPGYCQTVPTHTLTPLESAERDMIVQALEAHGGNRVSAANALGVSRSTLYRKLKSYGISG